MSAPTAFSNLGVAVLVIAALAAAAPSSATAPTVVATEPTNGATGVAADLHEIVISFSESMDLGSSISGLHSWAGSWNTSLDVLTLVRSASEPPWIAGQIITVTLNLPPYYSFANSGGELLGTYAFTFTVGDDPNPDRPSVVATTPINGAADVGVDLESIEIEFSESMSETDSLSVSGPWPLSNQSPRVWSSDGQTLRVGRDDPSMPLPYYAVITLVLNPAGSGFEDLDGHQLGATSLVFTTGGAGANEPPSVTSSDPAHGARGVGVFQDAFTVNFSKTMTSDVNIVCTAGNWGGAAAHLRWAPDGRSFTIDRPEDTLLRSGALVSFTLNPGGAPGFRDTDDNPLPETVISFQIEGTARLLKILPKNSSYDFDWPYYLWIPSTVAPNTVILVEPNNTGGVTDREFLHDAAAVRLIGQRSDFAERLNLPLLVPAFPRPLSRWWMYTHALDADTMTSSMEGLVRIDLQLIEMIEDARERLADLRIRADEKVLMMGFSASGQFTNRFAILHPERILAATAGSPGGWPLAPAGMWQGETLNYNVGIADVESLLGRNLDMAAVRAVPLMLYMGDADTNDAVPYGDAYNDDQRAQVYRLFGMTPVERWPIAESIYEAAGMNTTFVLYPGVGHWLTEEIYDDIADFFSSHLPEPKGWLRDDPGRRVQP